MQTITMGTTARKQTKLYKSARRKNQVQYQKDNAAASNEPINFRERIIWRFQKFGHVSLSPLIIMVISNFCCIR